MQINRFNHIIDRYNDSKIITEYYSKLDMSFAMKSINLKEEQFTNFVKSKQSEQYKLLLNIYSDYKKGKNILDKFEAYDVELYSKNTKRLSKILSYNTMENFNDFRTSNVLKHRLTKSKNKLRLYIEEDDKKNLSVKLIDLYHLAIPSSYKGTSADVMKNRLYNQHKNNKTSISCIKREQK